MFFLTSKYVTNKNVGYKFVGKEIVMFIGRKEELNILHEKLNSKQCELGIIYGQRRIGKTSLILESIKEEKCLYLLARDDTYQNN